MQSTRIIKMSQQRHSQMATLTDRRRIRHTPIDRTADRPILLVAADGIWKRRINVVMEWVNPEMLHGFNEGKIANDSI